MYGVLLAKFLVLFLQLLLVSVVQASRCNMFSCPRRGGFPIICHNELRDLTAHLLTEVCHDVRTEPDLQPLMGETFSHTSANSLDGTRLDIAVNGLWGVNLNGRTWMWDSSIHLLHPILTQTSPSAIVSMRMKRRQRINKVYEKQGHRKQEKTCPAKFS